MRARLALRAAGQTVELREIVLRDKPAEMLAASPKGTVPVLVLPGGAVIDESLDIMDWALARHDPEQLAADPAGRALIAACETEFKGHLDRYKYHSRHTDSDRETERGHAAEFIWRLDGMLAGGFLMGGRQTQADLAIAPFVRQFANTDRAWFDAQQWTRARRWLAAFEGSAAFAAVMPKFPRWHPGDAVTLFP